MSICPRCGRPNASGALYCATCGARLPGSGGPAAGPRPAILARLSRTGIAVEPGDEAGLDLEVRNVGAVPADLAVVVSEDHASWISADPDRLLVAAGATGWVRLRVAPPAAADAPVGLVPFAVRLGSVTDEQAYTDVHGHVTIGPLRRLGAALIPERSEGGMLATHRVDVANHGNAPLEARVTAYDRGAGLAFDVEPSDPLRLEPGESAAVTITVRPREPAEGRRPQSRPFQVRVEAPGAEPVLLGGEMLQRPEPMLALPPPPPRRRRGAPVLILLLLLVVIGLVGAAVALARSSPFAARGPAPATITKSAPGRATAPVTLVVLPDVACQGAADATRVLGLAGVTALQSRQPSQTVPQDAVIRTDPPAGVLVPRGGVVMLILSSGPSGPGSPPTGPADPVC